MRENRISAFAAAASPRQNSEKSNWGISPVAAATSVDGNQKNPTGEFPQLPLRLQSRYRFNGL
jgi:hypothetical protein